MNHIALAQSVLGLGLRLGHGFAGNEELEPAYTIEDIPVYHIRRNQLNLEPQFDRAKALKWGQFTHPYLMMGMPDIQGEVKAYVTKVGSDLYAMHLSAKLDPDMAGPSDPAIRLAAFTPQLQGDTREKAGIRLFKAVVLAMDMVTLDEVPTNHANDSPDWERDWAPSERCLEVFRWVRGSKP